MQYRAMTEGRVRVLPDPPTMDDIDGLLDWAEVAELPLRFVRLDIVEWETGRSVSWSQAEWNEMLEEWA